MCTLALAFHADRRWPLVVAANRDERLGRASEGWALRATPAASRYAAPRDALAGGTWIGVGASGLFAGITNFHASLGSPSRPEPAVPRRRSSARMLGPALGRGGAGAGAAHRGGAYNPFHLVVADAATAFLWWYDGDASSLEDLGPGLHVVTERDSPRTRPARRAVAGPLAGRPVAGPAARRALEPRAPARSGRSASTSATSTEPAPRR